MPGEMLALCAHYSDSMQFSHKYQNHISTFPSHIHDVYEMIFLKKGTISYTVEGKVYQLAKNSLIISRPLRLHSITMCPQSEYDRYDILFDEKILSSDIFQQISQDVDVINFDGNTIVPDLFKKMDYYCEHFEGEVLHTILANLTEEILFNVLIASKNFEQSNVYTVNPFINEAIEYIDRNITQPLNLDAVCRELHITKSHLHNLFAKHLKVTPKKYIISKKLALAQRQIRSGTNPTEVYLNCGFSDYSAFYRDYKKQFGYSPSEEKNQKNIQRIEL